MRDFFALLGLGILLTVWIAAVLLMAPFILLLPQPQKRIGELPRTLLTGLSGEPREQQQVSHCNAGSEREPPERA